MVDHKATLIDLDRRFVLFIVRFLGIDDEDILLALRIIDDDVAFAIHADHRFVVIAVYCNLIIFHILAHIFEFLNEVFIKFLSFLVNIAN